MTRLALLALCAAMTACAQPVIQAPPQPPIAQCDAVCWQPCDATGIAYAPAPATTDAIGDLVQQVIVPLRGRIDQCELSRLACQQCIDRLERAGVIR
jgi:hypothetical protein